MQWWCAAQAAPWDWTWTPYPGVWLFLLGLAGGRALIVRGAPVDGDAGAPRTWSFAAGLAVLWLALDWPLGLLGASYLASAHMVQFLLIALVAPPLLLRGVSTRAIRSLPVPGAVRRVASRLTHPLVALVFFGIVMAWTHWPVVVDTWMSTQIGSFALDTAWLVGGVVFWWPVVDRRPLPWFGLPAKIGYLVLATIANTGLFMYLTYAQLPLYAVYELSPPGPWLGPRDDQVLAGVLMKAGGGVVLWTAATILFARWYLESSRDERSSADTGAASGDGVVALPGVE